MKRLALALLLAASPAPAQDVEQVTVYGGNLSGFWHVTGPSWLQMTLFGHVTWGPLRGAYCRLSHDTDGYTSHCPGQGAGRGGTLSVDGTHFHLAWGTMLARMVYDGEVTSATAFSGHFAAKLMGIPITNPDVSEGTKILTDAATPDGAGKAPLLRAVLAGETIAHDPKLDAAIAAARADQPGKLERIMFLGRQVGPHSEGPKTVGDQTYLAAYAVEYGDGERICWLHDDDGKLAAFECS